MANMDVGDWKILLTSLATTVFGVIAYIIKYKCENSACRSCCSEMALTKSTVKELMDEVHKAHRSDTIRDIVSIIEGKNEV